MKKCFITLVAVSVFASAIFLAGCGSTSQVSNSTVNGKAVDDGESKVVDWQGKNVGMSATPEWVQKGILGKLGEISEVKEKKLVPYFDATSKHGDLKVALNNAQLEISSKFATNAIQAVTVEASNSLKSSNSSVEALSKKLVGLASQAVFPGLKEIGIHWVRDRYSDGRLEYNVFILAGMEYSTYEKNISKWLDDNAGAETEEEKAALAEMKKAVKASAKAAGFVGIDD